MERFLRRLQSQAEENPMIALALAAAVLTASSKFINAAGAAYGQRTWSKEVARRTKSTKK
jgi:hypothetical protein